MSEPVVELRAVSKAFGEKVVLDAVDLAVARGEVLVILGGSGSGKSVTLRHMNGLTQPDAGSVFVEGVEVSCLAEEELGEVRRKVGMLFQMGALFDSMTVFENVAFALFEHTKMTGEEIAPVRAFTQLTLPLTVLISPLCATRRYGCASSQAGKVLVEKRWWTSASAETVRGSARSR